MLQCALNFVVVQAVAAVLVKVLKALLHIRQELVQLPKLLKLYGAAACPVVYANDVSYSGQAEVEVAKLQRCLQLYSCQLVVAILVNSFEPLRSRTACTGE
eukprot:GHRQ01019498.1.p1 GENE.GHRQ01019498.1~~GHRQ01019498.1.p1  ORF type:complete len:101 (-),score=13.49 GHRQ01019498.1:421-723(-)